jgi:Secretion system C-terminal sorting domain
MKKRILSVVIVIVLSFNLEFAQTVRTSLYEVFTSEDCGPCVYQNTNINAVVNSNQSPRKIIILRYQVGIPTPPLSPTSLYQQNPIEPTARQNYYVPNLNIQGVPQGFLNGMEYTANPDPFSPSVITQTSINTAYSISAPFGMTLSHRLNATMDSVKIKYSINAAQVFTTNNPLKLRMAICEQNIHYAVAPGTNGETDFEWVMRKMIPDVNGIALATNWSVGQTLTDSMTVVLPNYIWDKNEVTIAAFIQEDKPTIGAATTIKTVHQVAYSAKQPLILDVSAYGSFAEKLTCTTTLNTRFKFKNTGLVTITSATIEYDLNGGLVQSLNWTGTLAPGDTTSIAIPIISGLIQGIINKVTLKIKSPNGLIDYNTVPDSRVIIVDILPAASPLLLVSENFSSTVFPPANWHSLSDDNAFWNRSTSGYNSVGSAKLDFYSNPFGSIDELLIENQNFTGVNYAVLTFNVASAPYGSSTTPENDELKVLVSENCGASWTSMYQKSGLTLNTALAVQSPFIPTMATQWRAETIVLPVFTNPSNVIIKFVGKSALGNNLYVDNIQLNKTLSISKLNAIEINNLNIFPNPAKDNMRLRFSTVNPKQTELKIFDVFGKVISVQNLDNLVVGLNELNINVKDLSNGIYSVQLNQNDFRVSKSFAIQQ